MQHLADVLVGGEGALEDVERLLGDRAAFHVDAHERIPVGARAIEDQLEVRKRVVVVDVHAHRGQLDRDVGIEPRSADLLEHLEVDRDQMVGGRAFEYVFAEEVEGRAHARVVELLDGGERRIDSLTRDEALREKEETLLERGFRRYQTIDDGHEVRLYDASPQNPLQSQHQGRQEHEAVAERQGRAHALGREGHVDGHRHRRRVVRQYRGGAVLADRPEPCKGDARENVSGGGRQRDP